MRGSKRKIFFVLSLLGLLFYLVMVFIFINKKDKKQKTQDVILKITNPNLHFIDKKKVFKLLKKEKRIKLLGLPSDSINKNKIEIAIRRDPYVEDVQVYSTVNGQYVIELTQRSPIMRVITPKKSYYLDKYGYKMPTETKNAMKVHLYLGNISTTFAKKKLLPFQMYLEHNPFWGEMIDYVSVDKNRELTIYLRIKSGKIKFGKPENPNQRLAKLLLFINKVGKFKGLYSYEAIDLRFDNQVVGVKK